MGLVMFNEHIRNLTHLPDTHFQTPYVEPVAQNNPPDDADLARIEGYKIRHRTIVIQQVKLQDQHCQLGFAMYHVIQELTDDSILTDCKSRVVKWMAVSTAANWVGLLTMIREACNRGTIYKQADPVIEAIHTNRRLVTFKQPGGKSIVVYKEDLEDSFNALVTSNEEMPLGLKLMEDVISRGIGGG